MLVLIFVIVMKVSKKSDTRYIWCLLCVDLGRR